MKVGEGRRGRTSGKLFPDIYFLMRGNGEKWYVIKSSSLWSSSYSFDSYRRKLKPALPPIPESIEASKFAAIGFKIYASGGIDRSAKPTIGTICPIPFYPRSNKVFSIDTRHLEEGWKAAPPMKVKRLQHYMLADAGKIYVLGGLNLHHPSDPIDGKRVFAEVYDPSSSNNSWKPLARVRDDEIELPQTIYGHGVVEEEEHDSQLKSKNILFHAYYFHSLFYLNTGQQDDVGVYDNSFGQCHSSSAFLDGVFYFLTYNRIYAYDVFTRRGTFQRVVLRNVKTDALPHQKGFDESLPLSYLLSLGNGYLALIWTKDPDCQQFINVHCSIIKMFKEGDSFVGQILNCSTYSVERGELRACMAVSSLEEDVSLDGEHGESSDKQQVKLEKNKQQHKRKWDQVVETELEHKFPHRSLNAQTSHRHHRNSSIDYDGRLKYTRGDVRSSRSGERPDNIDYVYDRKRDLGKPKYGDEDKLERRMMKKMDYKRMRKEEEQCSHYRCPRHHVPRTSSSRTFSRRKSCLAEGDAFRH